jgi:FkbM family methyltransferase
MKNIIYGLLEILFFKKGVKKVINGDEIIFPVKWGRYFAATYELENYQYLKQKLKPDGVFLDVGAHLGLFSIAASKILKNGKVYAFEPTNSTFKVLSKILQFNNCKNVEAFQAAVSNKNGEIEFYNGIEDGSNANSIVNKDEVKNKFSTKVKTLTIDAFCEEHIIKPSFIKIDAEGAELDVLRGAKITLTNAKPTLILALHPSFIIQNKHSLEEIYDFLKLTGASINFNNSEVKKETFIQQKDLFDVHVTYQT